MYYYHYCCCCYYYYYTGTTDTTTTTATAATTTTATTTAAAATTTTSSSLDMEVTMCFLHSHTYWAVAYFCVAHLKPGLPCFISLSFCISHHLASSASSLTPIAPVFATIAG